MAPELLEVIYACDGGMHSADWGRGLNSPAVNSVLCGHVIAKIHLPQLCLSSLLRTPI